MLKRGSKNRVLKGGVKNVLTYQNWNFSSPHTKVSMNGPLKLNAGPNRLGLNLNWTWMYL